MGPAFPGKGGARFSPFPLAPSAILRYNGWDKARQGMGEQIGRRGSVLYGTLKHLGSYQGIHPGVMRGLELLRDTDFAKLEDGRYEVDGDDLFFFIQSYGSKPANDTPEAHRRYVDIQYLISGRERMGVAPLEDMEAVVEARPEGDIWLHRGPTDEILVTGDRFAVFWPEDAHAPGIAVDGPEPCRKCVVKVRVN